MVILPNQLEKGVSGRACADLSLQPLEGHGVTIARG